MQFELWLTFAFAQLILSLIPGPSVFLVVGQALQHGTRAAVICILGDLIGYAILITLSLAGVGAMLLASSQLFLFVKWAGVFYLAWLGISQIRNARIADSKTLSAAVKKNQSVSIGSAILVGALNPKTVVFYVAFVAQFLDPSSKQLPQFVLMGVISLSTAGLVLLAYALLASSVRSFFMTSKAQKLFAYLGGGCLLGGSVLTATSR